MGIVDVGRGRWQAVSGAWMRKRLVEISMVQM